MTFDFVKYLNDFVNNLPEHYKYINDYLNGRITKQQLDEFIKGVNNENNRS